MSRSESLGAAASLVKGLQITGCEETEECA
jgi:hypothetical protein